MDVTEFVSHLDGLRAAGPDRWLAKCPAHADRSPSFSVKGLPDGRILMHCFAGCDTGAILGALGLTLLDLFPERLGDFSRVRPAFTPLEALRALSVECGLVAIAAANLSEGKPLTPEDHQRVCIATGRITAALEFVHGS